MEQFQCIQCDKNSSDNEEIKVHMVTAHNIKIEEETISETIFCTLCNFKTRNMNYFKKHMINAHDKESHNWWTEDMKSGYYCDSCEIEFSKKSMLISHLEADHLEEPKKSQEEIKSEYYDIKNFPDNKEDDEEVNKAYGKKKQVDHTGIMMKGRNQAFKDANIILKSKLTKGMVLTDEKGRELKILNILDDDSMEVEVRTLSKKSNEKRGQVRLKMYRPNPSRKKDYSIQVTRSSGYSFVFVKTLVEMFLKPIIDSLINEPSGDPLECYIVKPQNRKVGKDDNNMKKENKDNKAYCEYCDKMFYNNKGLKIHKGRMHNENANPNNPTIEINKRKWELCDNMCQDCGTPFTVKEGLRWHIGKCQKRRKNIP